MTSGILLTLLKIFWVFVVIVIIIAIAQLVIVVFTPFASVLSLIYKFAREQWVKHFYAKAQSIDGKLTIYVGPSRFKIKVSNGDKKQYKLHIDGEKTEKIKIIISVDSIETINSSKVKVYINGSTDNSHEYKLKDLPNNIMKSEHQYSDQGDGEDLDDFDKQYFENEVEGYRIWFEDTYYWGRYWGSL